MTQAEYQKKWRIENEEHLKALKREYYLNNLDKHKEWRDDFRKKNPEYIKEYKKKYHADPVNKAKISAYLRNKRKEDINFKLKYYLRTRLNSALRNKTKTGSVIRDLGCSIFEFKLYIENQFESGMAWDNYGKWHLDHVVPLSHFNLEDRMEYIEAVNWLNIQPMWAADNLKKSNKI